MAASYEAMGAALLEHLEALADEVQALVGRRPEIPDAGLPGPKMPPLAVWIELPESSKKAGFDLTATDENVVAVNVAVSFPYDMQRDNPLLLWKLSDVLNVRFPDEMPDDLVLRHSRARGVTPQRDEVAGKTLLIARMRLDVPIYTRP